MAQVRVVAVAVWLAGLVPAAEDVVFEVRETATGNRLLMHRPMERTKTVWVKGGRVAVVEGDFVQIRNLESSRYFLVDRRAKQYAEEDLASAVRARLDGGQVPEGVRAQMVSAPRAADWNGRAAEQSVVAVEIAPEVAGLPFAIEATITEWSIPAQPWKPGENSPSAKANAGWIEAQYDRELDAAIQTMAVGNVPLLGGIRTMRSGLGARRFPVRIVSDVKLRGDSAAATAVLNLVQGESLLRCEIEVQRIREEEAPLELFSVPVGCAAVEMGALNRSRAGRLGLF
jgi:hypothetical protein